ncbi:hypothetical protein QOZ95_000485 [Paenibacillus brasilensis]|uniref:Uncharacterized protein n=1 Tax=Paenibacillus brasilensis TaxID=128574 RepID=A0ABU0KVR2_9BACL|nr:hypothetical protein [Paenibacillus brasilensis]
MTITINGSNSIGARYGSLLWQPTIGIDYNDHVRSAFGPFG